MNSVEFLVIAEEGKVYIKKLGSDMEAIDELDFGTNLLETSAVFKF